MKKKMLLAMLLLALVLLLAACGGGSDTAESSGDSGSSSGDAAANGEMLYNQVVIGSANAAGCLTCHSLEPDVVLVGPSHAGLANRAGNYQDDMSAEDYLRESILDPDAHIVEGYVPGVMPPNLAVELKASEVNDLVAYMMTLK